MREALSCSLLHLSFYLVELVLDTEDVALKMKIIIFLII